MLSAEELAAIWTLDDFERLAPTKMSLPALNTLLVARAPGITAAENRTAFNRIKINQRVMVDVSKIDTRFRLFRRDHPFPILLAPVGYHKLVHPEGELETVRGAELAKPPSVPPPSPPLLTKPSAQTSRRPMWFQLYMQPDRSFTKDLVQRVLAAGCEALCISVDVPVNGPRDRELRAGFKLPPGIERANLTGLGSAIAAGSHRPNGRNIYSATHAADVTWKDIEWLRSFSNVPLLLKGVLNAGDAMAAADLGCDGIIVSNHGGRSLDTVQTSIDALPNIAKRVGKRIPLILDGGVRRGIDVFKALALGASAVMIGRPYMYGLAAGGALGVARIVEILRTELEMTMGLAGCTKLSQISPDFLINT